jgi:hypothetical protein
MAKQGQHNRDARDSDVSRGPNNPEKSITITTGTYKKKSTSRKQAAEHRDPAKPAQAARRGWRADTKEPSSGTRARHPRSGRSGSDSNADSGTRGS